MGKGKEDKGKEEKGKEEKGKEEKGKEENGKEKNGKEKKGTEKKGKEKKGKEKKGKEKKGKHGEEVHGTELRTGADFSRRYTFNDRGQITSFHEQIDSGLINGLLSKVESRERSQESLSSGQPVSVSVGLFLAGVSG